MCGCTKFPLAYAVPILATMARVRCSDAKQGRLNFRNSFFVALRRHILHNGEQLTALCANCKIFGVGVALSQSCVLWVESCDLRKVRILLLLYIVNTV